MADSRGIGGLYQGFPAGDELMRFPDPQHLAQFAGLLTAFLFGALLVLLSNPPEEGSGKGRDAADRMQNIETTSAVLLTSVYCMLVVTVLFLLTRVQIDNETGVYMFLISSILRALGFSLMFFSLMWLFRTYSTGEFFVKSSVFVFQNAFGVLVVFVAFSAYNTLIVLEHEETASQYLMLASALPLLSYTGYVVRRFRNRTVAAQRRSTRVAMYSAGLLTTVLSLVFAIVFGTEETIPHRFYFDLVIFLLIAVVFAFLQASYPDVKRSG